MPSRVLDFPVFDADNHMYETTEAFTKFLPAGVRGAHQVRRGEGSHEDRGEGPDQRLHPEPHLRGGGRARAPRRSTSSTATPRASPAGRSWASRSGPCPAFFDPEPRLELHGRAGHRPGAHVADAGQPARGAPARRPAGHPRRHPRPQPVDARALDASTTRTGSSPRRSSPCPSWTRPSRSWSGWSSAGPGSSSSGPRPCPGFRARARSPCPSSTRSGSGSQRPTSWSACTPPTTATSATPTSGRACATARCCPSRASSRVRRPSSATSAGRSWTPWPRRSATACAPASRRSGSCRSRTAATGCARSSSDLAHAYERTPHVFDEDPVEVFKRNIWVHPFHEEDPIGLVELLGADRVLFGSDYPHPEGMADPISFVDELDRPARRGRQARSWAATWPS